MANNKKILLAGAVVLGAIGIGGLLYHNTSRQTSPQQIQDMPDKTLEDALKRDPTPKKDDQPGTPKNPDTQKDNQTNAPEKTRVDLFLTSNTVAYAVKVQDGKICDGTEQLLQRGVNLFEDGKYLFISDTNPDFTNYNKEVAAPVTIKGENDTLLKVALYYPKKVPEGCIYVPKGNVHGKTIRAFIIGNLITNKDYETYLQSQPPPTKVKRIPPGKQWDGQGRCDPKYWDLPVVGLNMHGPDGSIGNMASYIKWAGNKEGMRCRPPSLDELMMIKENAGMEKPLWGKIDLDTTSKEWVYSPGKKDQIAVKENDGFISRTATKDDSISCRSVYEVTLMNLVK